MLTTVGIIVGSLRRDSYTRKVATAFAALLPEHVTVKWLQIADLPLYNEDLETTPPPEAWTVLRRAAADCDGVLFFTPEYNRSVPAALKNALDVGSRPYGENVWAHKPALVVSVSPGAIGGFGANHHLRQSLTFLDMPTLQQPEAYIGNVTKLMDGTDQFVPATSDYFKQILSQYLSFAAKLS
ncbi:NADPH-dependent FMN reductase [Lacticaseibacillus parakribbianus]|uniref:NADPH-dependent FMN reductase n=1 Tax=Lacticaseibacillus parakribbianus TaxID=2970927 RepID=UPI0021CB55C2|nr:NAD(P)H-dependent oxidoreductase [Lacticaseibacillus parakribbianus]